MNRRWRPLELKCLTAAVAVALLAAPSVQAAAGNTQRVTRGATATNVQSVTAAQHVEPNRVQPNTAGKSYFWSYAAILGGVLTGIVVLGLWGDIAIGSVILGIQLLGSGCAIATRTVGSHARKASRRVFAGSNPAASSRSPGSNSIMEVGGSSPPSSMP